MVRTQIQLTEEQVRRVKAVAVRQGISTAEVIRRSLDRSLIIEDVPDREEVRRRVMALAGRYADPGGDVAARHDEFLAEAYRG